MPTQRSEAQKELWSEGTQRGGLPRQRTQTSINEQGESERQSGCREVGGVAIFTRTSGKVKGKIR
jgi:hypothetical protein